MVNYVDKFEIDTQEIVIKDSALTTRVNNLPILLFNHVEKDKNILFIGDSWTVGSGATNPSTEKFSTLLSNSFEMNEFNYGVGASGFARPDNTFLTQCTNAINNMTSTEKDDTRLIMVVGGVNDLRNIATETLANITTAITNIVNTLKNAYPKAIICFSFNIIANGVTTTMLSWLQGMRNHLLGLMSNNPRLMLIDNMRKLLSGRTALYTGDYLHPNTLGHSLIAGYLHNALMGGETDTFSYVGLISPVKEGYRIISGNHIFTNGEEVIIEQGAYNSVSETGQQAIATLPVGSRPQQNAFFNLYRGSQVVGAGVITNNGTLYFNQTVAGSTVWIPEIRYLIGG